MKAKTFENLLRKIIREEIDYSLRRELKTLKEDLRDELKPTIVEHTERMVEIPETTKNSLKEKIMGTSNFKPQNFTKNTALNDLLNETAKGDTNLESANAAVMPVYAMPAEVANVVNRDYRALMQAIDKKKNR